jgi:hypothetical protein
VLYGPHRAPQVGAWVVLHHIRTAGASGPIDSVRTGPQGRYSFTGIPSDTAAVYVASSRYEGIAYFSEPTSPRAGGAATLQPIVVYDTTSRGPPVRVQRRLVTIARPKPDGTRAVLEFIALENPGRATRVAPDSLHPNWAGAVPHEGIQFQVGQGDVSADAIELRDDSVLVFGPIPPGDPKQLAYSYVLPATTRHLTIPIDQPIGELELLLEDTTTAVTAPDLETLGVDVIEQRHFAGYRTHDLKPAATVALTFPQGGFEIQGLLPYTIALLALALVAGLVVALKRSPLAPGPPPA